MDYDTMRSRLKIGDSGLCIVHGLAHRDRNKWQTELEISLIGIPDHPSGQWDPWKDATLTWMSEIIQSDFIAGDSAEDINETIRRKVRKDLAYQLVKKPVVLSHVAIIETNKG
jgi:mRNA degradation ribonuclease J1/J2